MNHWLFSLFFGNDTALEEVVKASPLRETRNCITQCRCAKSSIPRVMFVMGVLQVALAWLLAVVAFPIFVFSVCLGVGSWWFSVAGFVFWACTQLPGATGIWFGLTKAPKLGYVHIALVALAGVLIEIGSIVNLCTLSDEFVRTSCIAAHTFASATCDTLAPKINVVFWVLAFVAPVVTLAATWFSVRFLKILNLYVKYEQLNEVNI